MIVRIAELQIDPDRIDTFTDLLSEEIEASVRLEPGVVFLFAVSVKGSPYAVRVIEGYDDQGAYEAHLATPHVVKYKTATADMVTSLQLIETDPISLMAKDRISNWTKP
jgi:quinol monooxygenase YgiN